MDIIRVTEQQNAFNAYGNGSMQLTLQHLTWNFPDFLVVGAAKSGTSSLHHYLNAHPQIFMPQHTKELWFWHIITNPNKAVYVYIPKHEIPQSLLEYLAVFEDSREDQI